jgi:hypothetical protein
MIKKQIIKLKYISIIIFIDIKNNKYVKINGELIKLDKNIIKNVYII